MLVQALAEYADRNLADQLSDPAWENKPVPWLLEVSAQGTFLNITPRMKQIIRGKKRISIPMEMSVPRSPVNRNGSKSHPLIGTDDISYVLGPGAWTSNTEAEQAKARNHHRAFVELIKSAAESTQHSVLKACVRFYADPAEVDRAREALQKVKSGSLLALSVGGPLVELESVRSYWRSHYTDAFKDRMKEAFGECLISGKNGVIAPTHEKIKGAEKLGGHATGVALMSFEGEATRSYGWDRNQNSPVSPDRALAYVLALNDLMRLGGGADGKRRRKDVAGVGFLYWLRDSSHFDPFEVPDAPDVATVEALLTSQPVELNPNQFYMVGVSGNGGRLRVRYWVTDSLRQIKANLRQWREQLCIAYPWSDPKPVRFSDLLKVIDKEGDPPARLTLALLRRAIEGTAQPLGYGILAVVVNRLRHSVVELQNLRVPMGLVRLCLNDIYRVKGAREMSEGLDRNCTIPAYLYGRLMAEFENLQRASSEIEVNVSVSDRYFSMASTYPAVAFPKLENLSKKHLRKLSRDNPGAAYAIDASLLEIHNKLRPCEAGPYPRTLSIEGQGLFILGYYHQKAWSIEQARDHKQPKDPSNIPADQENQ